MSFPQLRVRSGYSFKSAYGREVDILARLKDIGAQSAAMVDVGTWGHVRWEKAASKAEVAPMFGVEIPIKQTIGHEEPVGEHASPILSPLRPRAWMLAQDTKPFYKASTRAFSHDGLSPAEFGAVAGTVRFPGGALRCLSYELGEFDYIDLNPSSLLHAADGVREARRTGAPIAITSYNDMPSEAHTKFAYAWTVRSSVGMRHIATEDEIWSQLQHVMTRAEFDQGVRNSIDIADRLNGVKLAKAPMIHMEGDLAALCEEGKVYRLGRGHIAEWTQAYQDRMVFELEQIAMKDFDSYFLVVSDLIRYAKQHMLVGPARGSSAGSLVCYLLGITEIDPIPPKLLFQRFIDVSRSDLPDIDIDFADTHRYMVFDYLQNKFGAANVVKLGNINTLKANSVMAQVGKSFGIPYGDTDQVKSAIIEYSSADERYGKGLEDTLTKTEPGQAFKRKWGEASKCMGELELHPSHSGVHAAGIVVCNDEISDYCTVDADGIAQIDKKDSEYLNLLKIDALGLRTLGVIQDAGVITNEQLYDLKMNDPNVLQVLNDNRMSGIFQFEGQAVRSVSNLVHIDDFGKIDNITALARPGPLSSGMAVKYIERVAGREEITYSVPQMEQFLGDTFGVFLYQEQIMSVVKEIGLFDWVKTSMIRKAMSGRQGEEFFNKMGADFIAGATSQGIPEAQASTIWQEMVTFGAWGFNKSHSYSYAVVTYWTCYLKCYHKLEFAAACLRSAKDEDQTIAILRELWKEGITYTALDPEFSDMNWKAVNGKIVGGIMNAKGYGPVKAAKYIALREEGKLTDKQKEALANAEVNFSDLNEAHTRFGHYYENPRLIGVTSGMPISSMHHVKDRDECVIIAKLMKKVVSDENEPIRIKKRGGTIMKGQTQFLDMMLRDDSVDQAMRFRIKHTNFTAIGKKIAEEDPKGSWYLVRAWKLPRLPMFIIKNIKRIDNLPDDSKEYLANHPDNQEA